MGSLRLHSAATALAAMRTLVRPRLTRRGRGFVGGLAIFLGIALIADAAVTVVWQDPITAMFAQRDQKKLDRELTTIENAPLSASTMALVENAETKQERLALLAARTRAGADAGEPLGRISMPSIDKRFVFVSGTGERSLKRGPGHYAGAPLPGERGTVAVAGHRTTYLAPFRRLDRMRRGDRISLRMPYGRFSYSVLGVRVVQPSNGQVLQPASDDRLVLTTCTPLFSSKRRLVLTARLERSRLGGPAPRPIPTEPSPAL